MWLRISISGCVCPNVHLPLCLSVRTSVSHQFVKSWKSRVFRVILVWVSVIMWLVVYPALFKKRLKKHLNWLKKSVYLVISSLWMLYDSYRCILNAPPTVELVSPSSVSFVLEVTLVILGQGGLDESVCFGRGWTQVKDDHVVLTRHVHRWWFMKGRARVEFLK